MEYKTKQEIIDECLRDFYIVHRVKIPIAFLPTIHRIIRLVENRNKEYGSSENK